MSFVGVLSSVNSLYYICGNFNIHAGDSYKFVSYLDSCDLKHLQGHILDLILSPSDQDAIVDVKICDLYLIMH